MSNVFDPIELLSAIVPSPKKLKKSLVSYFLGKILSGFWKKVMLFYLCGLQ